jgi:hypothetical protein
MTESQLWRNIRPIFTRPTRPIVEDAVTAIGQLPGIDGWDHQIRQPYQAMKVVEWGIPCHFIREAQSFDILRRRLASGICTAGSPVAADLSECQAAGLLVTFQTRVEYLSQQGTERVPDLLTHWPDGSSIEIEVTSAEKKQGQRTREESASSLREALSDTKIQHDVYVHVLDLLSDAEQRDVVQAASKLNPGSSAELQDRWHVQVQPMPPRDPRIVFTAGAPTVRPSWFPAKIAIPFTMHGLVAGPDETAPIPRLFIYWGLTTEAYINPVEKKASRFQGSGNRPFIVAIDISSLSGARTIYEQILPDYFTIWDNISGVLAFEFLSDFVSKVFWTWQFFCNPGAKNPISDVCAQALKPGPWNTEVPLYLDPNAHP